MKNSKIRDQKEYHKRFRTESLRLVEEDGKLVWEWVCEMRSEEE